MVIFLAILAVGVLLLSLLLRGGRNWWTIDRARGLFDLLLKGIGIIAALVALEFFVFQPNLVEASGVSFIVNWEKTIYDNSTAPDVVLEVQDHLEAWVAEYQLLDWYLFAQPHGLDQSPEPLNYLEPDFSADFGIQVEEKVALCDVAGEQFRERYEINDCNEGSPPYSMYADEGFYADVPAFVGVPDYVWLFVQEGIRGRELIQAISRMSVGITAQVAVGITNAGPGDARNVRVSVFGLDLVPAPLTTPLTWKKACQSFSPSISSHLRTWFSVLIDRKS